VILGPALALAAGVAYGVSDVLSGWVVRRHSTAALALWSQVTGFLLLAVAALVLRPAPPWPGIAWGAAGGAVGAVALLASYAALQRGPTSVVAPVAGAGVVLPLAAGLLAGEPLGWAGGVGIGAVVVGVLVVTATGDGDGPDRSGEPEPEGPHPPLVRPTPGRAGPVPAHDACVPGEDGRSTRSAVGLAALAALGFGGFFLVIDVATADATGLGPSVAVALAVQAGALVVTALAAVGHTRACLAPRRPLLVGAVLVALVDAAADVLVVVAVGIGPLAVVGPLASLDPVVSVVLAALVLGERLRPPQLVGVAAVLGGVLLVATA
jgi:drug/metabolite transporter (DMT)-like permease